MRRRLFLTALPLARLAAARAEAPGDQTVVVFAAASLTDALEEIGRDFTSRTGCRVLFSFGASSDLARQIRGGAPADVFVSADRARMAELEAAGLVRAGDRVDLLSNRLAIIVPAGSPLTIDSPSTLVRARRIALADPQIVPAGVYARQWLEARGVWASVRDRVVPTLDVRAALAAVASGAVEAGIVYRTDARLTRRVKVAYEVAASETPSIVYPAAVLAASPRPSARPFFDALRAPAAQDIFTRWGFAVLAK